MVGTIRKTENVSGHYQISETQPQPGLGLLGRARADTTTPMRGTTSRGLHVAPAWALWWAPTGRNAATRHREVPVLITSEPASRWLRDELLALLPWWTAMATLQAAVRNCTTSQLRQSQLRWSPRVYMASRRIWDPACALLMMVTAQLLPLMPLGRQPMRRNRHGAIMFTKSPRRSELMFAAGDVSQIVTRLRSSRSARHERELRSSLSALGRCSLEGLQATLAVPVLDGTLVLVVPVPDSTAIGRAMCEDCHSSMGLTASSGRRCRRSFLCTVCG